MAVLCLAAVATKQSFVAAGVAAAAFLWLRDRRTGLRFAGALVGLGLLALALALGHWGPGFWYSTVTALRNPQSWAKFAQEWRYAAGQPLFVFVVAVYAVAAAWALARWRLRALTESPYLLYSLAAWLVLTLTVRKTGSAVYYFIEPFLASLLWLASAGPAALAQRPVSRRFAVYVLVVFLLAVGEWQYRNRRFDYSFVSPGMVQRYTTFRTFARAQMAALGLEQPRVLNLLLPRVTYDFGPQAYLNDCVHYRLLWQDGTLDHRPLVSALERHAFDCVILPPHLYSTERQANPRLGAIVDAVQQHYVNHGEKAHIQFFVRPKQTQELEHAQAK